MSYVNDMFGLEDKIVILTGGGGVIAGAMSEALLKCGAKIALWDNIFCAVVDTMDDKSVAEAIAKTEGAFGRPNVLINAAGGNRGKSPFVEIDKETFEFV
ncbi:MAG: SDR family oxidoreductase, partial [Planctomycetota bacterium]